LSFSAAAALPLTSLTAYEALFEKLHVPSDRDCNVLIIGGAGGVGSIAIQLVKQLTKATVYATFGRSASLEWLQSLKVDGLIDRNVSLRDHFENGNLPEVEFVFSTTHSDQYLVDLPAIISPFGQLCLIDDPQKFDALPFKRKAASIHWEFMFAKSMYKYNMESQGRILNTIAQLAEEGKIHSTAHTTMYGLSVENFVTAHKILESSESIGKITVEY
jgi:NADPH2:quinone reductase